MSRSLLRTLGAAVARPFVALGRYHRDAFDAEGVKRRGRDIGALWDLARHGPREAPLPVPPSKALRASAVAAYLYGGAAALAYGGVLWQLTTFSASLVITAAWALAATGFAAQTLLAAARNWRLRTGRGGGIGEFLDGPGPHWPRLRG